MKNQLFDVIIAGAGITGLTIAFLLKRGGLKVLVLEKEGKTGGVISSVTEGGFTYETGPNTGVLSSTELVELFGLLKEKCTVEGANPKAEKRYILKNSRWEALPSGLVSGVTTPLFTLKDKFRILGEPFRKPGTDPDEPVASLVRRRMGKSFLDYAVDPFISGIYAGDPEILITRYALPKLYNLEQNYGSFILGAIKKGREPKSEAEKRVTKEVFSVEGGLANLVNALTEETGRESIILNVSDTLIAPFESRFKVSYTNGNGEYVSHEAGTVITTFGGEKLCGMLPFINESERSPLMKMRYAGVVQAAAGFRKWDGLKLDAFGGLIPSKENRDALGILYPSSIFKNRAPENGALLSVFLGGIKKPDIIDRNDDDIKETVLKEIRETLNTTQTPDLLRIFRYRYAIPQYDITTGERLDAIKSVEGRYPGLILAGNIRDGIGISDRVKQAFNIAGSILKRK
jgi:oxygen-dependent protoporphyrinogen oxidase